MKIGIVTDNYLPDIGGTEISIVNYSQRLRELGHEVYIFCPSKGSKKNPDPPLENVIRLRSIRYLYPYAPLMFVYPRITKLFKRYDLDVLHSQSPLTAPYIARHVSKKLNIPHVHTMHTLMPEIVKRWREALYVMSFWYLIQSLSIKTFRLPDKYLLQDETQLLALKVRICWAYMLRLVDVPDKVVFPSKHVLEMFRARNFKGDAEILPTFSDMFTDKDMKPSPEARRRDKVRLIYVGRLDIEKRPQIVIDAVNLLPDYLNWELEVVGDGNQRKKLEKLVKEYDLQDHVKFMGKMDQEKIAQRLIDADIFVMSSYRFDTQGIVLLEACGAGLPIVYCDDNLTVGVEPTNSVLTKPHAWGMAQGMEKLINDNELRETYSIASKKIFLKYNPMKMARKIESIYKKAITDFN